MENKNCTRDTFTTFFDFDICIEIRKYKNTKIQTNPINYYEHNWTLNDVEWVSGGLSVLDTNEPVKKKL